MKLDKITHTIIILLAIILLHACAQSGNRLDDMEAKVVVMNQRIEQLNELTGTHLERKQQLLELIQADLKPIQDINDSGGVEVQPLAHETENDDIPGDIRSVPLENMESKSLGINENNPNPFELAQDAMEKENYEAAAHYYIKAYESEQTSLEIQEYSLYKAGESLYLNRDWEKSVDIFLKFIREYPDAAKIPSVLTQIGECYRSLQQFEKSDKVFEFLKTRYPENYEDLRSTN